MLDIIKLKHWQLFIFFGTGYILNLILSVTSFSMGSMTSKDLSLLVGIITIIMFFLWVLLIGLYLNNVPNNPHKFKTWILSLSIFFCIIGYSELLLQRFENVHFIVPLWISFLLTLFSFFGLFYTFYNVPKSLKSIELEKKSKFSEYIISSILLFAFPIGVWFIQPRLNRIYEANNVSGK